MLKRVDQEMLSECYNIILEGGVGSGRSRDPNAKPKEPKEKKPYKGRQPGTIGIEKIIVNMLQEPGGIPIDKWNELVTKYLAKIKRSRYGTTWQPASTRESPPLKIDLLNASENFSSKEMLGKMSSALGLDLMIDQATGNVIGITDEPHIVSIANKLADNLVSELGQHFPAGANASLKRSCGMLVRHLVQKAKLGGYKYNTYSRE